MSKRLRDLRKYPRLSRSFQVSLHKAGVEISFMGFTQNISQSGAFIQTEEWQAFRKDEQALLTFYLPPDFTGQDTAIRLLGTAFVVRVDKENEGLGLQFNKVLRQFERNELFEANRRSLT